MRHFLWEHIGKRLWQAHASHLPQEEVKRQLDWMTLDCEENRLGKTTEQLARERENPRLTAWREYRATKGD